jgi:hypothetical protein
MILYRSYKKVIILGWNENAKIKIETYPLILKQSIGFHDGILFINELLLCSSVINFLIFTLSHLPYSRLNRLGFFLILLGLKKLLSFLMLHLFFKEGFVILLVMFLDQFLLLSLLLITVDIILNYDLPNIEFLRFGVQYFLRRLCMSKFKCFHLRKLYLLIFELFIPLGEWLKYVYLLERQTWWCYRRECKWLFVISCAWSTQYGDSIGSSARWSLKPWTFTKDGFFVDNQRF